ncbi:MAG: oligosaccharide flippase family protein [Spirochaetes bacterium]|nr:oligosaccharide flippase family protein [Spirochaetota bacterium]
MKQIFFNKIKTKLTKNEFNKNVFTLMFGTALAQVIPFLLSPIISRLYIPEAFGKYSLFISISGLLAIISTGKYEMAIILPKYDRYAYHLVILSGILTLAFSFLVLILLFPLKLIFKIENLYFILPFVVFAIGLNYVFDRFNNRIKNYKLMSLQRITKSTVESIVSISFAILFKNSLGLIWGFAIGYICSNLVMIFINYKNFKNCNYSKVILKTVSKKYINFPRYTLPHSILNTLSAQIPIYFIPIFFSGIELGYYSFGLRIVQAPLSLISQSLFNVLGQKFSEEYAKGKSLLPLFNSTLKKLLLIALFSIPFFIFAPQIFGFIFGDRWLEAGKYIRILSPWIILSFIVSSFAVLPYIYQKQKKAFILEFIYFVIKIIPFFIFRKICNIYFILLSISLLSSILLIYSLIWYFKMIK